MIRRLRIKFVCITMAIVTVMLCVIFAMVLRFTQQSLEAESFRILEAAAQDPASLERPGQQTAPYFVLQIWPYGVRLVTGGGYYGLTDSMLVDLVSAALDTGEPIGVLPVYNLRFRRLESRAVQGFAFVDISGEVSTMRHLVQNCAVIGCISLVVFFLASLALARWAVGPVDEAWRKQRQFVADASHELKTPLTVILTNAELLQSPAQPDTAREKFGENILAASRQMRGLVEDLLELAKVDGGLVEKAMEPVDFSRLICEALLPFEPVFFESGLLLESQIAESIVVQGSPIHLRQVADILLDNARKYTAPEGQVEVRLCRAGGKTCLLSVATPGDEISGADLKNIFKRFDRMDESRSRDGGYGLGLAIAQGLVEAHSGKIWAESERGVNTFFVRLPLLHRWQE